MKLIKISQMVLLAAAASLAFTACSPDKSDPKVKAPTDKSFKALAGKAGYKAAPSTKEEKALEKAIESAQLDKAGAGGKVTGTITAKIKGEMIKGAKVTELTIAGIALAKGGVSTGGNVSFNEGASGIKPDQVSVKVACDATCEGAVAVLSIKVDEKTTVSAALAFDFRSQNNSKMSSRGSVFMKAK